MVLSEIDRQLLQRCLTREPRSWDEFVDRFLGLVTHVIQHTARCRSIRLTDADRDDLTAEVFLAILDDDFALLRRFRGQSSLATYLTVIARRVVVRELIKHQKFPSLGETLPPDAATRDGEQRIQDRDQVERLLKVLNGKEADIIRMYHLEGKSYREISTAVGIPENSIGPTLSRARAKMREAEESRAES